MVDEWAVQWVVRSAVYDWLVLFSSLCVLLVAMVAVCDILCVGVVSVKWSPASAALQQFSTWRSRSESTVEWCR